MRSAAVALGWTALLLTVAWFLTPTPAQDQNGSATTVVLIGGAVATFGILKWRGYPVTNPWAFALFLLGPIGWFIVLLDGIRRKERVKSRPA